MSAIVRFIIEVENVRHEDYCITQAEAEELLSDMEEILAKRSYSLFDSRIEMED